MTVEPDVDVSGHRAEITLAEFNYRASIAPGAGNAGAGFDTPGDMESATLRVHATWNLLSGPVTPFVTAAVGVIFLDTNFRGDPPANACWVYPWYGQVCSDKAPRTTLTVKGQRCADTSLTPLRCGREARPTLVTARPSAVTPAAPVG